METEGFLYIMTKQRIIEGNRLIAKFMGGVWVTDKPYSFIKEYWLNTQANNNKQLAQDYDLKYHKKWNWLMPVVEKIESIHDKHHGHFAVYISSNICSIQGTNLWKAIQSLEKYGSVYMSDANAVLGTKIESTWYNIVQFIEWFNEYKESEDGKKNITKIT